MQESPSEHSITLRKDGTFAINKIFDGKSSDSLMEWAQFYFQVQVVGSPLRS